MAVAFEVGAADQVAFIVVAHGARGAGTGWAALRLEGCVRDAEIGAVRVESCGAQGVFDARFEIGLIISQADFFDAAGMFGGDGPAVAVIGPAGEAHAVFVDDTGQRVRPAGVFVEVLAAVAVRMGDRTQVVVAVIAVAIAIAGRVGDGADPVLAVIGQLQRAPERVGDRAEPVGAVIGQGL